MHALPSWAPSFSRVGSGSFREKARKAVRESKGRLITGWVGEEAAPPISVVLTDTGEYVVQPMKVAEAFAREWGALWRPPPKEKVVLPYEEERRAMDVLLESLAREDTNPLPPPLTATLFRKP